MFECEKCDKCYNTKKKSLKVKYVSRKSKNIYDGEMKANYLQCHVPAKVSRKT